jgi:hypothetical protein
MRSVKGIAEFRPTALLTAQLGLGDDVVFKRAQIDGEIFRILPNITYEK